MNDPVMFVLGLLLIGIVVLFIVDDTDQKMYDAPTSDEMTTVIPDPFAPQSWPEIYPEAEHNGRRVDTTRPYGMGFRRYDSPRAIVSNVVKIPA